MNSDSTVRQGAESKTRRPSFIKRRRGVRRGPAGMDPARWRNEKYKAFLREHGMCAVCFSTHVDPAHGPVNGMSSKGPDAEAIPMCDVHHKEQHRIGWPAFEAKYFFSRARVAMIWWAKFLETKGK